VNKPESLQKTFGMLCYLTIRMAQSVYFFCGNFGLGTVIFTIFCSETLIQIPNADLIAWIDHIVICVIESPQQTDPLLKRWP
jgi:hypothetical protein